MCSGIWPPSKRLGTWYRALVPLVPRPAVLPLDASPRPTRVLAVLAPGAGRRWCSFRVPPLPASAAASAASVAAADFGALAGVFAAALAAALGASALVVVVVVALSAAAALAGAFSAAASVALAGVFFAG